MPTNAKLLHDKTAHAVLILAAGESRRLGTPKQLLSKNGTSLVRYMAERALETHPQKILVVIAPEILKSTTELSVQVNGSGQAVRAALADLPIHFAINPTPSRGLSSSIQIGAADLNNQYKRILILGIDQPCLALAHLTRLLNESEFYPNHNIVSFYADTVGLPALVNTDLLARCVTLKGDVGLKALLLEQPDRLIKVACPELEFDIDNQADLELAKSRGWVD